MSRTSQTVLRFTVVLLLACVPLFAQRRAGGGGRAYYSSGAAPVYGRGGAYGGYGYGFYPSAPSPLDVPPNYWWVSPYRSENPCQAGCNPNAGYEWDSVGTLILETNPPKARITLDGIFAGTTDNLGPFQLPVGEHTLHVQAPGFESSDVIVKFDQPGVQNLNIELKRMIASAKPAPQR
jgi:hypothetical protein